MPAAGALPAPPAPPAAKPAAAPHPALAAVGNGETLQGVAPPGTGAHREPHPGTEVHLPGHPHTVARHLRLRAAAEIRAAEPPVDSAHPPRTHPMRRSAAAGTSAERPSGPAATASSPVSAGGQASSFDELLTHLTGRPRTESRPTDRPADRTSDQPLTPPAPGAPDPFAPRGAGGPPDQ
jgi:hypothetical protein